MVMLFQPIYPVIWKVPHFRVFPNERRLFHRSRLPCRHPQAWMVPERVAAPVIKWRRSIWDGSPAGPRGPSVFHERQCPLRPPRCFLSLPTHPYGLIYSTCSLHQSVAPCQFGMAFYTWVLMAILEVRAPWEDTSFPHFFFLSELGLSVDLNFSWIKGISFLLTKVYLLPDSQLLAE